MSLRCWLAPILLCSALVVFVSANFSGSSSALAQATDVQVTFLGSHDGEFCSRDRAMVFEDI
jgi:hypothetical protein